MRVLDKIWQRRESAPLIMPWLRIHPSTHLYWDEHLYLKMVVVLVIMKKLCK